MRKALIAGIDWYERLPALGGCTRDARAVGSVLERNFDRSANFAEPRLLLGECGLTPVSRRELRDAIEDLFTGDADIALLYFAGHGHIETTGGYICCSDTRDGDDGIAIEDIVRFANASAARNKVIILDSCHSGAAGNRPNNRPLAEISIGTTILTASEPHQYAMEGPDGGGGVFTTLLVDALSGAAANLLGHVTPAAIYAYIDRSLGPWEQRPLFKTHVRSSVHLRKAAPPIPLADLLALPVHFPTGDFDFALDPSYEPDRGQAIDLALPAPDPAKTPIFATLQRLAREGLVRPVGADHMYYAAMGSRSCRLTSVGEHWRSLAARNLIQV
ncbi:caspase family protein [Acidovorax sp. RAC01]|uniref:caspase family protein n=1 Tax=Acidovorax sp. RAC01 TaxID=1842533 RepID=UPI00083E7DB6|nr:caspase family protein [Acidovorax sp. RAC01]AOG24690.1 caspase domain protein [Acidovorax sp. RAC01]